MRLCANDDVTVYEVSNRDIENVLSGLAIGLAALHSKGHVSVDVSYDSEDSKYIGVAYVHN